MGVNVLEVMDDAAAELGAAAFSADGMEESRAAVAELMKCCDVTIKAFEALGRTDGIASQIESHRECERALIEQKAALSRCNGGAA